MMLMSVHVIKLLQLYMVTEETHTNFTAYLDIVITFGWSHKSKLQPAHCEF